MDEKAVEDEKIKRISEIIYGSENGNTRQPPFIKDIEMLRYLRDSTNAKDLTINQRIEKFYKKHPEKSPAILSYLVTQYLTCIELEDAINIDSSAPKEGGGSGYFTQRLLEAYQKETPPSPQASRASGSQPSSSSQWRCCIS